MRRGSWDHGSIEQLAAHWAKLETMNAEAGNAGPELR